MIAYTSHQRRVGIFEDIERSETMWTSVYKGCSFAMDEVLNQLRSKKETKPTASGKESTIQKEESKNGEGHESHKKRLSVLQNDNIFTHSPKPSKPDAYFQDPEAVTSRQVIGILDQWYKVVQTWLNRYRQLMIRVLESPIGFLFQCKIERQIEGAIIPNSVRIRCAISSLSELVCKSMEEDKYGSVQRDIAAILSHFDEFLIAIDLYLSNPPLHWSDIDVINKARQPDFKRLVEVRQEIETGFFNIVNDFREYLDQMNISAAVRSRISRSQRM